MGYVLSWFGVFIGIRFFFSSRRRHTRCGRDWSSDVCSSDLALGGEAATLAERLRAAHDLLEAQSADWEFWHDAVEDGRRERSEERRVGKECRCRGSPYD